MKYYVSYMLNRNNAKLHRYNHGFGNNNKKAGMFLCNTSRNNRKNFFINDK